MAPEVIADEPRSTKPMIISTLHEPSDAAMSCCKVRQDSVCYVCMYVCVRILWEDEICDTYVLCVCLHCVLCVCVLVYVCVYIYKGYLYLYNLYACISVHLLHMNVG